MAELTNTDIKTLFLASVEIRRSSRTMDFAQATLEDIRKQAIEFIGGTSKPVTEFGDSTLPLGKLDKLKLLEDKVNQTIDNVIKRGKVPTS